MQKPFARFQDIKEEVLEECGTGTGLSIIHGDY